MPSHCCLFATAPETAHVMTHLSWTPTCPPEGSVPGIIPGNRPRYDAGVSRPPISEPMMRIASAIGHVEQYFTRAFELRARFAGELSDFAAGDPQEMAFDAYVDALTTWSVPKRPDWFAYKMSEPGAQEVVARSLRDYLGVPFEPQDVALTNAAIAGLAVTLRAICQPGDEVIIIQPPHFLYEPLIMGAGASTVRVPVDPETLDLDVDRIEAAITPNPRGIIRSTPHNPTGKIFPPETL